jgi:type II secretory pathway predicted ATPase ExeA
LDFRYFGLRKSPFEQTTDVQPFYINDAYREAFVALRYGIELRLGLVVLTGESGVGKTSLVTLFRNSAKKNVRLLVLSACSQRPAGLLFSIVAGLELELPTERRAGTRALKKYLLEESGAGQIVAIIIDDADELSLEDLGELKTLLSLRSDGRHLVQIILVGSPTLALLNYPALKSLRQRVRVWAKIPPLASQEVEAYIEHKLSFAGSILRGYSRRRPWRESPPIPRAFPRRWMFFVIVRSAWLISESTILLQRPSSRMHGTSCRATANRRSKRA